MNISKRKIAAIISASLVAGASVVHADQTLYRSPKSAPGFTYKYQLAGQSVPQDVDPYTRIEFKKGENLTLLVSVKGGTAYQGKKV